MTITTEKINNYAWKVTAIQGTVSASYQSRNRSTAFKKAVAGCRTLIIGGGHEKTN